MKLVERIEIKYFRSFGEKNVKISDLKDLNIFSGSNDVGKSNVLKALNLFFNNEINIGEEFDLNKDLSFLQRTRSENKIEVKKTNRSDGDPYTSQRDLFVKVKIFFNRKIPNGKPTTPEKFWVEKTWDKNGFTKQTNNILTAYKKKNNREPTPSQAAAMQGQVTQFLNSISYEYIPAVKDRQFLQYLFKKLQTSLFERDSSFRDTSNGINKRITGITGDLFQEFRDKTGIEAEFTVPESLIDFFTTINVSTENGISLYSRGDGMQARFIPAILNEISKGKKNTIWGFEEPENSYEYRNAEALANDFLNTYSIDKQIFITSHTKEFLSLINENEDKVSLHRVYKTLEKGSMVDTFKKDKGFDKDKIQISFWDGVQENEKTPENQDILNKIFRDIGFLENDQYLIEDLQKRLITQRTMLEKSGLERSKQEAINKRLLKEIESVILNKKSLEAEIEEYRKPILYVEDKYDQLYKIAYLKLKNIEFDINSLDEVFKNYASFIIRRGESANKVTGRLRAANHDGYEDKKIIGLYDFDKEGREQFHNLNNDTCWGKEPLGNLKTGFYKKRNDHDCFYALLLPIPDRLNHLASLEWANFISYVEIENLLPTEFLKKHNCVETLKSPGGEYLKIKERVKERVWKGALDLDKEDFENFQPLFEKITALFNSGC